LHTVLRFFKDNFKERKENNERLFIQKELNLTEIKLERREREIISYY